MGDPALFDWTDEMIAEKRDRIATSGVHHTHAEPARPAMRARASPERSHLRTWPACSWLVPPILHPTALATEGEGQQYTTTTAKQEPVGRGRLSRRPTNRAEGKLALTRPAHVPVHS